MREGAWLGVWLDRPLAGCGSYSLEELDLVHGSLGVVMSRLHNLQSNVLLISGAKHKNKHIQSGWYANMYIYTGNANSEHQLYMYMYANGTELGSEGHIC